MEWDPEGKKSEGFIMACKLDQMGFNVIAASSKQDEAKIIDV